MESILFKVFLFLFLLGFVIFMAIADRRITRERLAEERARLEREKQD